MRLTIHGLVDGPVDCDIPDEDFAKLEEWARAHEMTLDATVDYAITTFIQEHPIIKQTRETQ